MEFVAQIIKIATSYYPLFAKLMVLKIQITWTMAAKIVRTSKRYVKKHVIIVHLRLENKQQRPLQPLVKQV